MTPHQNPQTGAGEPSCPNCGRAMGVIQCYGCGEPVAPSLQGGEAEAVVWVWRDHGILMIAANGEPRPYNAKPLYAHPKAPELDRALALIRTMLTAIEAGQIDSPELDGEPEVGIPPHRWHEEWEYSARSFLALASKQGGAS